MAQSTLHFSFGMIVGTLTALPSVWRAWRQDRPVARMVGRWCLLSYALGLYAVLPAIIRRLTDDPEIGSGPWWNLFLLYPLLDRLQLPSIVGGELAVTALFMLQYSVIVLAIQRARRRRAHDLPGSE